MCVCVDVCVPIVIRLIQNNDVVHTSYRSARVCSTDHVHKALSIYAEFFTHSSTATQNSNGALHTAAALQTYTARSGHLLLIYIHCVLKQENTKLMAVTL